MYSIVKSFKFNGMHIVRNCSSSRCKYSVHAHTYKVELELSSMWLDNGQMVVDFGLLKGTVKSIVNMFNDSVTIWSLDDPKYIEGIKEFNPRWVEIPFSPSAEQYSRLIFILAWNVLQMTEFKNGEYANNILKSVTVWETRTGKSTYTPDDNPSLEDIKLSEWKLSHKVKEELAFDWDDFVSHVLSKTFPISNRKIFKNEPVELQVKGEFK